MARGMNPPSRSDKLKRAAKEYSGYERTLSEDALARKERGEKGYVPSFDRDEVEARVRRSESNYKENAKTPEGRELNKRNMEFQREEASKVRATNSRAQYDHERDSGDPNALKMSFEEWKKL
jgi:hypothetical protein